MLEIFTEDFFTSAVFAMLAISMVTGPLGSFMLWKKLSYLGDSISHSSLLGIAIASIFNINSSLSIVFIAIFFSLMLTINFNKTYSVDTILNILTNFIMSLGLFLISFYPSSNNTIIHSLFGDLLVLNYNYILILLFISFLIITVMFLRWKNWLMLSIDYDMAISEGINVTIAKLEFLMLLSIFIAITAQIVGILLITAFLVIPSAAARLVTNTPPKMILLSTIISIISGISGLILSVKLDTFPGPLIIIISFLILVFLYFLKKFID